MAKAPANIRSLARNHTDESIERLAFWLRSDNPKASVGAAIALLDRGWGKPTQPIGGDDEAAAIRLISTIERKIVDPNGGS